MNNLTFHKIHQPSCSKGWVLCFHHVGGSRLDYFFWRRLHDVEVWVAEFPNRQPQTLANSNLICADQWLNEIITFIEKTYSEHSLPGSLFGMSLGAQIAFQTGCKLENLGLAETVKKIFIASALAPIQFIVHDISHFLSADDNWMAHEFNLTKNNIFDQHIDIVIKDIIDRIRFDYHVYKSWQSFPVSPCNIPMTGFFGNSDPFLDSNTIDLWSEMTYGEFTYHLLDGGHFFTANSLQRLLNIFHDEVILI
ncbi:MAG: hypothetical protein KC505_03860 [Myxococcales bacterium]|nr:hypothetical protein [Myxococcales bacterium]USN50277.1 MAG: hypothetical protein H6731_08405 [Myxococcales bacterium]